MLQVAVCVLEENYKAVMPYLSELMIRNAPPEKHFLLPGVDKTTSA
jgi:hypothetical protein